MKTLQLQHAKAELSRVVEAVQLEGPVVITVRGKEKAVLISARDYARKLAQGESLWSFFRASPLRGTPLVIERDRSPARTVKL